MSLPAPTTTTDTQYAFDTFFVSAAQRSVHDGGTEIRLGSRAMDLLLLLLERAGDVVPKDELMARVWPSSVVDEAALRVHLAALRKALGDGRDGRRFIINVPQRGYSFVGSLRQRGNDVVDTSTGSASSAHAGATAELDVSRNEFLPTPLIHMVGRGELIGDYVARLAAGRCLSIVGMGGIGKTTVALALAGRVAPEYPDGVRFIDLSPLADPSLVPMVLATVLGVTVSSDRPLPELLATLAGRRMLLVLDSCEHVIDAAASLAAAILAGAPGVRLLNTSREPLRIHGESVQHLPSLDVPDPELALSPAAALSYPAVQMFVQRCAARLDGFSLCQADVATVIDICQRLDGVPLALELAAGRVDQFGLRGLAKMLDDRLRVLTRGQRNAAPRHRTLRDTLDWSYSLLAPDEQRLFQQLGIFAGRFTEESASAVCGGDTLDGLSELAAKSLLAVDLGGMDVQYRLLDVTRAYAAEKLALDVSAYAAVRRRHAQHYLALAQRGHGDWQFMPVADWIAQYRHTLPNVRTALEWAFGDDGDASLGVTLTMASQTLFCQLSLMDEYRRRVESALRHVETAAQAEPVNVMRLTSSLANLELHTRGITPATYALFERTYRLACDIGVDEFKGHALTGMWFATMSSTHFDAMCNCIREFGQLNMPAEDRGAMHDRLWATCLMLTADYPNCLRLSRQIIAQPASKARGAYGSILLADRFVSMHCNVGRVLWITGYPDQALQIAHDIVRLGKQENAVSLCLALAFGAILIAGWCGRDDLVREWGDLLTEHAQRHGLLYWRDWGAGYQMYARSRETGVCEASGGRHDSMKWPFQREILHTFDDALYDPAQVERMVGGEASWSAPEVLRRAGRRILAEAEDNGPRADVVNDGTAVTGGQVVSIAAAQARAEALFQQSLQVSIAQGARAWELRTLTDLAQLRAAQGRGGEGRALLAHAVAGYTEGHATADLRRAAGVLTDLST